MKINKNIIISNPKKLAEIKKAISADGADKLHILTDFDRTLTMTFVDGKNVSSLISILRDENYLTPDYPQKAKNLYAKYRPFEIDVSLSIEEKKKKMREWWTKHFNLLIESGLNKSDLENAVKSERIKPREGVLEFFDLLKKYNIPLVILSSSGLGKDSIEMFLKERVKLYSNIYIISNSYNWNKNGIAVGVNEPIIHSMNKDEIMLKNFPVFEKIRERKNVLLLGDSLGDVNMITGFDYNNLIKIGFLNRETEKNLKEYKRIYDVLISNDGPMDYVNEMLKEIICHQGSKE